MRKGLFFGFIIYLLFGIYFLNSALFFVVIPELNSELNKWIIFFGGVLIILGAINYIRISRRRKILPEF